MLIDLAEPFKHFHVNLFLILAFPVLNVSSQLALINLTQNKVYILNTNIIKVIIKNDCDNICNKGICVLALMWHYFFYLNPLTRVFSPDSSTISSRFSDIKYLIHSFLASWHIK